MKTEKIKFADHEATIIIPDNQNGKWIWKTEFFYAFDAAERVLCEQYGYTRVYYSISNKYGSPAAVRLMHNFYLFVTEKYNLSKKFALFGFSRGGLYAFNFALSYPEYVDKIYLDAPVLDMKSWPRAGSNERSQVYEEFALNEETINDYRQNPIDNIDELLTHNIPMLVVAGGADEVVPFAENSKILIDYAAEHGYKISSIVKPECKHHPHSLEDVTPIIDFIVN